MGVGIKIFFIDENDSITKIPISRFERMRDRDPDEALPQYKDSKIRYAEVTISMKNRKPSVIRQMTCGYLKFDDKGLVDRAFLDAEIQTAMSMISIPLSRDDADNVIQAKGRFAKKRFQQEFRWTPSLDLEAAIIQKVFA